ncbi:MAG TPA: hypothetical protein VD929_08390 [Caulobacteraceae bacterium]|nr:hypothetical protein [Caulobacteraceae bacterium]
MHKSALAAAVIVLAAASGAAAQDHAHHAPPAAADPHAGHDMGEEHSTPATGGHAAAGVLGTYPMSREASGTAWQPDAAEHGGVHWRRGGWAGMSHATLNLVHSDQQGPRGDRKTFLAGMVMASARRDLANGDTINLRAMLSPDLFMGKRGYPLLLQAGETADGVEPLVDRQHPHELFVELSASYAWRLGDTDSLFVYAGLPGEPAYGPATYMHRASSGDSPEAPIAHHWLDSTHIVFGVLTAGWVHDDFKLEASSFRGREPDQDRYDIEAPELDSWSVRASWNPSPNWALQVSHADVTSPEGLEPDLDVRKTSASASYTLPFYMEGWWSTTAAWGRNDRGDGAELDAFLLETTVKPRRDPWTFFARAERIETDELHSHGGPGHGDVYRVGKLSLGAIHDWKVAEHVRIGLGALYAFNFVPEGLEHPYGDSPDGSMVFVRLKVD